MVEHAATKGDDLALGIADRKHDALAETVITLAVIALFIDLVDHETGLGQGRHVVIGEDGT